MFVRPLIVALFSAIAYAQSDANPFKIGSGGLSATAGQSTKLQWNPTTQGTVSLILRSGSSNDLADGETIAKNIPNSGSYTWNVPSDAVRGSDYTIEIVSDSDPSATNFTPYFVLESTNTVASASPSSVTLGAPSSSLHLSTASPTATMSPSAKTASTGSSSTTATSSTTTSTGQSSSSGSATESGVVSTGTPASAAGARATAAAGMLGIVALGALVL